MSKKLNQTTDEYTDDERRPLIVGSSSLAVSDNLIQHQQLEQAQDPSSPPPTYESLVHSETSNTVSQPPYHIVSSIPALSSVHPFTNTVLAHVVLPPYYPIAISVPRGCFPRLYEFRHHSCPSWYGNPEFYEWGITTCNDLLKRIGATRRILYMGCGALTTLFILAAFSPEYMVFILILVFTGFITLSRYVSRSITQAIQEVQAVLEPYGWQLTGFDSYTYGKSPASSDMGTGPLIPKIVASGRHSFPLLGSLPMPSLPSSNMTNSWIPPPPPPLPHSTPYGST